MSVFKENKSLLIGLSGTFGAGKDTAANHLVKEHRFMSVSTGDVLRAEADKLGLDHQRQTLIDISVEIRKATGNYGELVNRAIDEWQKKKADYPGGLIISGLRLKEETEEIKKQGGVVIWVDAPLATRYARVLKRAKQTGRTVDAPESVKEFTAAERSEYEGKGPGLPNLKGIKSMADIVLINNGSESNYLKKISLAIDSRAK